MACYLGKIRNSNRFGSFIFGILICFSVTCGLWELIWLFIYSFWVRNIFEIVNFHSFLLYFRKVVQTNLVAPRNLINKKGVDLWFKIHNPYEQFKHRSIIFLWVIASKQDLLHTISKNRINSEFLNYCPHIAPHREKKSNKTNRSKFVRFCEQKTEQKTHRINFHFMN